MNVRSRFALLMVVLGAAAAAGMGCGSDEKPKVILSVDAFWNESPATVDDTGYQLSIDAFWPDRAASCFSLPADLHVTVNDKQVPLMIEGNCGGESLVYVNGFQQNVPVTIRLEGGGQVMGEAVFDDMFPGAGPFLVSPADGQAKPGDPLVVQLPLPPKQDFAYAEFFWMEPPAGVPPYHTSGKGTLAADGSTFQVMAPTTAGRAAMVVKILSSDAFQAATSCTGFDSCHGVPETGTLGPFSIDVVP
jgi:hypothetical protein